VVRADRRGPDGRRASVRWADRRVPNVGRANRLRRMGRRANGLRRNRRRADRSRRGERTAGLQRLADRLRQRCRMPYRFLVQRLQLKRIDDRHAGRIGARPPAGVVATVAGPGRGPPGLAALEQAQEGGVDLGRVRGGRGSSLRTVEDRDPSVVGSGLEAAVVLDG
jgi:hypothetical protein